MNAAPRSERRVTASRDVEQLVGGHAQHLRETPQIVAARRESASHPIPNSCVPYAESPRNIGLRETFLPDSSGDPSPQDH
jgi:hypothetical protein